MKSRLNPRTPLHHRLLALAIAAASSTQALSLQLDDGSGDWSIRWDNTLKYNLMTRVEDQDDDVVANASPSLADDADLGYDTGIVSNRFDLLTELDVSWRQQFGFRVSAAGWYDQAYGDDNDHPGLNCEFRINGNCTDTWGLISAPPGELSEKAEDQAYTDGELLDAFIFGNFSVGEQSEASVRLGRHTIYWGNSLYTSGAVHGIAGSMAPIDLAKGLGVPGAEAKELFMPTNKLSGTFQVNQSLSLVGFYSFEFEPTRYPAVGTYLGLSEVLTDDAEFATLIPGQVDPSTGALLSPRTGFVQNSSEQPEEGEFGLGLQYTFEDGLELGVYYLSYHDKYPQGIVGALNAGQFATLQATSNPLAQALVNLWPAFSGGEQPDPFGYYTEGGYPAASIGRFKWTYREDNDLFGISLAREIAGISFGMDLVYRDDVAISFNTDSLRHTEPYPNFGALQPIVEGTLASNGFPTDNFDFDGANESNYPGPTGDTAHLVVNGVGFLDPSKMWDGGSYAVEFTASSLLSYGEYENLASRYIDEDDIATTIAVVFAPQWYQVMPSLDLRLPMNISYGINGHSPISTGGDQSIGTGSIGLAFEYEQVWLVDAKYNFFFGDQDRGALGNLIDRDNVTLTVKRTF